MKSEDPATRFVRSLSGDYLMLREAAEKLDMSHSTLRKYISDRAEGLQPSKSVMFGKVEIYLYTNDDIERMRKKLEERRNVKVYENAGRPRMYTPEEKKVRTRLFSRRNYWRGAAEKAYFNEDDERFDHARKQIKLIEKELEEQEKTEESTTGARAG